MDDLHTFYGNLCDEHAISKLTWDVITTTYTLNLLYKH